MGLEPTNLLTASQALYQLSYAPVAADPKILAGLQLPATDPANSIRDRKAARPGPGP
jgi:hypothetical protein